MGWENFLKVEKANKDFIKLNLSYIDMTGDIIAGIMLSQIIYWHLPSKNGNSKLRVIKGGEEWIAKRRVDWFDECRITLKQYIRAIKILEDKGIVKTKVFKFYGEPTVHISLNKEKFASLIQEQIGKDNG